MGLWKAGYVAGQMASDNGCSLKARAARRTCGFAFTRTRRDAESETVMGICFRTGAAATAFLSASLVAACALGSGADSPPQMGGAMADAAQVLTATTHPMKYRISLPNNWSADRAWPVLVAPNAHYTDAAGTVELFAPVRDAKKLGFIVCQLARARKSRRQFHRGRGRPELPKVF